MQNLKGNHPLKTDYNGQIVGCHNVESYAVKVNGTEKITLRNRVSLRKIPQPISIQQHLNWPRHLQGPGVSGELSLGQQGAASGSQKTGGKQLTPGVVTRTGTCRAPNTGINKGSHKKNSVFLLDIVQKWP